VGISVETGKRRGARPSINITPLVDVVLVLLIIFMVVTPLLTRQFWVSVPKSDESAAPAAPSREEPLVLLVQAGGALKINREEVPRSALAERLRRVFAARSDHALYVSIDDEAPYGVALEAMDLARAAGATPIALITDRL
jgi:biopolymer transport protein ExbD/biopolymer transport protein TolR